MDNNQTEPKLKPASKSFMTAGPTLHYSHENVQSCWLLALLVFGAACVFWSKILTGSPLSCNLQSLMSPDSWRLGQVVITGASIFEYPWQILVLGLLMGILAISPLLISQLMSFSYSLPFILAVLCVANLPGLAVSLLISCIAVACRPLRFRSRFIAIVLCTAPQLLYWGYFGSPRGIEPLKWGFSFTPWITAWLISVAIAAMVLGIGHYVRYRPGIVWAVTLAMFLTAFGVFTAEVGFGELEYQLYVANNAPEQVSEFQEHSITEAIDNTISDPNVLKYLASFFSYPTEPIPLRAALKNEIQEKLSADRWPNWFIVPPELAYQEKRQWLFKQYDSFIDRRPQSPRMPIALYCKGLLSEYSPDIKLVGQKEILYFYSDYPYTRSSGIWYKLYTWFGQSPESLEARWRIAQYWAGLGRFGDAEKILEEAKTMVMAQLNSLEKSKPKTDTFLSPFRPPADSVMTQSKLIELQQRLNQSSILICRENLAGDKASKERLSKFVMLNPHGLNYSKELEDLLWQMPADDPLRDNVLLAQTKNIADDQLRAENLSQLYKKFKKTDGGMLSLHELALLKISLWHHQDGSNIEMKKKYLADAKTTLTSFISEYPNSIFCEQAKKNLSTLPETD